LLDCCSTAIHMPFFEKLRSSLHMAFYG
jgi:hypothetical protein